jgi:HEAT repeat protein
MQHLPESENWNWARIRELAQKMAQTEGGKDLAWSAVSFLKSEDVRDRVQAVFLLGFTCGEHPDRLEALRQQATSDPSWEVQEALAQAFDAYCAAVGYETALPTIDDWLADGRPNARRAVSEGLRIWTSKRRAYFAAHPEEAIRRLAALRDDVSDYVRHSAGNALRDIRRAHADLVDAETATWNLEHPLIAFTYKRVLKVQ